MITVVALILIIVGVFGWGRFLGWLVNRADRIDSAPPEAAEAPDLVEQAYRENGDTFGFTYVRAQPFTGEKLPGVPYVDSGHQRCGGPCCAAEQLDELERAFDWHLAEYQFRSVA
jgi:hypothetical protein